MTTIRTPNTEMEMGASGKWQVASASSNIMGQRTNQFIICHNNKVPTITKAKVKPNLACHAFRYQPYYISRPKINAAPTSKTKGLPKYLKYNVAEGKNWVK